MTQPPVPPNEPPYQPGPSYPPGPRRSRGPLLIVGGLVLLLVLLVGAGVVLIATRDGKPAATETPAARTKPSDPKAVEFRRVLTSKAGPCPTPAPDGTACDANGTVYTLGKVELDGSHVSEVKADYQTGSTSYWYVRLSLDPEGAKLFAQLTAALATQDPPANLLAIVVHGKVAAAPSVQSEITGGQVQISGAYTRETAEALARQITG